MMVVPRKRTYIIVRVVIGTSCFCHRTAFLFERMMDRKKLQLRLKYLADNFLKIKNPLSQITQLTVFASKGKIWISNFKY